MRRQIDRTSGEPLLLHPEGAVELNPTADAIVQACDGACGIDEIVLRLAADFDVEAAAIRDEVLDFLEELSKRGLLA